MQTPQKFLKHSSIYAIATIIRQAVAFIMLPIYTQHLSPSDYGVVALMTAFVSVVELLFGARLGQAIPRFYHQETEENEQKLVISTALLTTCSVSALAAALLAMSGGPTSALLFGDVKFDVIVMLFSGVLFTNAVENYALIYLRILERSWAFLFVSLAKLVAQLSMNIWLVVHLELGVLGVAGANLAASSAFALLLGTYTITNVRFRFDRSLAWRMVRFSAPLWLAGIATLYMSISGRYFLRYFENLEAVGLFELASKLASVVLLLVWRPFAMYWQVERFNILKQDNAKKIYRMVFLIMSVVLSAVALLISIASPTLLELMSAPEFHLAAQAVPLLVFANLLTALSNFSNFGFLVSGRTSWIGQNAYTIAAIQTVLVLFLTPKLGFVGTAAAISAASLVQFILVTFRAKQHYDMTLDIRKLIYCVSTAASCCIVYFSLNIQQSISPYLLGGAVLIVGWLILLGIAAGDRELRKGIYQLANQLRPRSSRPN